MTRPSRIASPLAHVLVTAIVVWGGLAFGAVYSWAYWPLLTACAVLGVVVAADRRARARIPWAIAGALTLLVAAVLVQLLPLPMELLARISPATKTFLVTYDVQYSALSHGLIGADGGAAWLSRLHPLSIQPARTALGLAFLIGFAILLLAVAAIVERSAAAFALVIVTLGTAIAVVALVQSAVDRSTIYGFWKPESAAAVPFGPFVNPNHFAGWMLMASPLGFGYFIGLLARAMKAPKRSWRDRVVWLSTPEASGLVLTGCALTVMTMSVLFSLSRSGIACLVVALSCLAWFAGRKIARRSILALYLGALGVVCVGWVGTERLAAGVDEFRREGVGGRAVVWRQAWSVVGAFPLVGSGLDTFGEAMLVFQTTNRTEHYAEAHGDYLQVAAEGGVLLSAGALLVILLVARQIRRRFQQGDDLTTYWIRVGAVTGLFAIALQEIGEFSLQMPGNAALCSVLVGLAIHRPHHDRRAVAALAAGGGRVDACPKCNSSRVRRSRVKTRFETVRKYLTFKRLYRCHACGWRGWGHETASSPAPPVRVVPPPLDGTRLDAATDAGLRPRTQ